MTNDDSNLSKKHLDFLESHGVDSCSWYEDDFVHVVEHSKKMSHAILLDGVKGVGKKSFVKKLIQYWLILEQSGELYIPDQHPDVHIISSPLSYHESRDEWIKAHTLSYLSDSQLTAKKPSKVISIDQIRLLSERLSLHPLKSAHKYVVIYDVENLNTFASNALLKTLEEPQGDTLLVLLSNNIALVPETIRSRCMRITISAPSQETARSWLQKKYTTINNHRLDSVLHLANNAPLLAEDYLVNHLDETVDACLNDLLALIQHKTNPIQLAESWVKLEKDANVDVAFLYQWLATVFYSVYKQGVLSKTNSTIAQSNDRSNLVDFCRQCTEKYMSLYKDDFKEYLKLYEKTTHCMSIAHSSMDHKLTLEELFLILYKLNR